ncbi:GIY-YIG nuclease family protein [Streptomyces parvus]|uniref:GIY-YIG nuclease family protein n=1 Tax=Streptomyces parvus TaxID=66428 RepID=A0A7K3RS17_9ACTN|nr:GIY-YIG nuclease family protein [Streptomyces parvus]NEC17947.1 GIY-YIG nuclease family protein [Streptomyces parvus]
MGQTFIVHMDVAGHRIADTSWNWGIIPDGQARSSDPSYGTGVEVPAVVELLDLVASGAVSAEEARECVMRIATSINERMDREYARYLSFEGDEEELPAATQAPAAAPALDKRWVYAVSSEADPKAIKIGVAGDIEQRMRSLQIGSASRIVLRWSERGGYPLERHLHAAFDNIRISGEWFDFRKHGDPTAEIGRLAQAFLAQFHAM